MTLTSQRDADTLIVCASNLRSSRDCVLHRDGISRDLAPAKLAASRIQSQADKRQRHLRPFMGKVFHRSRYTTSTQHSTWAPTTLAPSCAAQLCQLMLPHSRRILSSKLRLRSRASSLRALRSLRMQSRRQPLLIINILIALRLSGAQPTKAFAR